MKRYGVPEFVSAFDEVYDEKTVIMPLRFRIPGQRDMLVGCLDTAQKWGCVREVRLEESSIVVGGKIINISDRSQHYFWSKGHGRTKNGIVVEHMYVLDLLDHLRGVRNVSVSPETMKKLEDDQPLTANEIMAVTQT